MTDVIVTCEHAGNKVPPGYSFLFSGMDEVLKTHRGWDPGALELARFLNVKHNWPLLYTDVTRLLVEANRSEDAKDLFSEFSSTLNEATKKHLLEQFYFPYRNRVTAMLKEKVAQEKVIHLSIHSFTPELDGTTRTADIGILYDPARMLEKQYADALEKEILAANNTLTVKHNYPYLGTADGFTTALRKIFPETRYAGIELEVNQKFVLEQVSPDWESLKSILSTALAAAAKQV